MKIQSIELASEWRSSTHTGSGVYLSQVGPIFRVDKVDFVFANFDILEKGEERDSTYYDNEPEAREAYAEAVKDLVKSYPLSQAS